LLRTKPADAVKYFERAIALDNADAHGYLSASILFSNHDFI
jgi:hypothetical protein